MTDLGHRITDVQADADTKTLTLTWDDGSVTTKAMAPLIGTKRLFRPLADPALFARAHIVDEGRALAWTPDDGAGEIDLCADALWLEGRPARNPFAARHGAAAE